MKLRLEAFLRGKTRTKNFQAFTITNINLIKASEWLNYLMFWESPVTWKKAPELGIQLEFLCSWTDELVIIALGTFEIGRIWLVAGEGLTQVLDLEDRVD